MFSAHTFNVFAVDPPPAAATAAKTVTELWKLKKFDKIESCVTQLSKRYPKRCCSVVASAFIDLIFRGATDSAEQKLKLLRAGIVTRNISTLDKFDEILHRELLGLKITATMLEGSGVTKADLKRSVNVSETREDYGLKIPELLDLMALSPDADLP